MFAQIFHARRPETDVLFDPALHIEKRLSSQFVNAVPSGLPLANKVSILKDPEVLRHSRLADVEPLGQFCHRMVSLGEQAQQSPPRSIGKRAKYLIFGMPVARLFHKCLLMGCALIRHFLYIFNRTEKGKDMRNLKLSIVALTATMIGASAWSQPITPDARLGPMAADLQNRVGTWCVDAWLQFTPAAKPARIAARAESRFVGNRWLVTELRSTDEMQGFHGLGINGYDPELRKYVGIWIDGTRGFVVPVEGTYDTARQVFRTTSTERRQDGQTVTVISETVRKGSDQEVTRFTAPGPNGRPYERMVLTYTRATDKSACLDRAGKGGERAR